MKKCKDCGIEKPFSEFHFACRARNIYKPRCKQCRSIELKKDYQENKDIRLQSTRKWQKANQEHVNEVTRRWCERNRDKVRLACRKWSKNNLNKCRAKNNFRRASLMQRTPSWVDKRLLLHFTKRVPQV